MKHLFFTAILLAFATTSFAQVGIGTSNPNPSAVLDLNSNEKGLLIPRMVTGDRVAIASPPVGLMVYDIDEESFCYYAASLGWVCIEAKGANAWVKSLDGITPADDSTEAISHNGDVTITTISYEIKITEADGIILKNSSNQAKLSIKNDGRIVAEGSNGGILSVN